MTAGWYAFNISSDRTTGLASWDDEAVAAYLATGHGTGHGSASGPMAEAVDESLSRLAPEDVRALVSYLRTVPPTFSSSLSAAVAPAASDSHRNGGGTIDVMGKRMFEGACVSCHGWSGESPVSPFATLTGSLAVNDPAATNVAQVIISGTKRHYPPDAISMPAFGDVYSDSEIAAVTNYVTARFGKKGSELDAAAIANLRRQTAQ